MATISAARQRLPCVRRQLLFPLNNNGASSRVSMIVSQFVIDCVAWPGDETLTAPRASAIKMLRIGLWFSEMRVGMRMLASIPENVHGARAKNRELESAA